jgi:hypothetical protein
MHLTGQTHARNLISAQVALRQSPADGDARSAPPVFGSLLGPADLRRGKRFVFFGSRRQDATVVGNNQSAGAAGTNINSQNARGHSSVL